MFSTNFPNHLNHKLMIRIPRALALISLVATLAVLSGCLSTDATGGATATVEETTFASSLGVDLTKSTRTTNGAYVRDIVVGTGALVANGQGLNVKYSGWLSDGTPFDSNESLSTTFLFHLGTHEVISGWDEGIPGMHVGGKRQIILPPSLAYGLYDNGPIPGNSVLVFNVTVVSAQ